MKLSLVFSRNMARFVNSRLDGNIFLVGINRPEKKNCVNHETSLQLISAFEKFNNDESLKVAILYGEGGSFCAGYDLGDVSKSDIPVIDDVEKYRFMGPSIMKMKKPLIAAIEGYAVAGGLELALMADLRVCSNNAKFGVFCRRVGVPLIDGGTVRLPRVVGLGRALEMILTGREVSSSEALNWGLVNQTSEDGKALETAIKMAKLIASHPEKCMLTDRESTYYSLDHTEEESFAYEFQSVNVLSESIKGAKKFIESQKSKKSSKL